VFPDNCAPHIKAQQNWNFFWVSWTIQNWPVSRRHWNPIPETETWLWGWKTRKILMKVQKLVKSCKKVAKLGFGFGNRVTEPSWNRPVSYFVEFWRSKKFWKPKGLSCLNDLRDPTTYIIEESNFKKLLAYRRLEHWWHLCRTGSRRCHSTCSTKCQHWLLCSSHWTLFSNQFIQLISDLETKYCHMPMYL